MGGHGAAGGSSDLKNIRDGAILQMLEAATLGMPFEVWKTRMGRNRNETTVQAFTNILKQEGVAGFWQGLGPKLVESASKGAVLLFAKEAINNASVNAGIGPTMSGFLAGAGAGVAQTSVMGPCTFLVTAVVTGSKGADKVSVGQHISRTWAAKGLKGFYPGGTAIAFRQATNWASRQGFTEAIRQQMLRSFHKGETVPKLTVREEVAAGLLGGAVSCWNHPFEVARIEAQATAAAGGTSRNMVGVMTDVYKSHGAAGLFKGVVPRIFLGMWQTLFMVTGAKLVKDYLP